MTTNAAAHEIRPDPQKLTGHADPSRNASSGVDYAPHPANSIPISAERKEIVRKICALYSGSASEEDMQVYDEKAIYVSFKSKGSRDLMLGYLGKD